MKINGMTNVLGGVTGFPQIAMGIQEILTGNYEVGIPHFLTGLALVVGLYFVGKTDAK